MDLIFNRETQLWEEKKEPFGIIEVETEEDFNRLRELVEADREGRCVVLPTVKKKDRESLLDALSEAVSSWGDMSKGEKKLSEAILAALKGEQD